MSPRPVALVTGASSGIGHAFARALAAQGHDLVAVARDETKLKELATLVPTDVEVLPADLTSPDELAKVEARLRDAGRPVDLLINNAGFGTTGRFAELPIDEEEREVRLNVLALTRLTGAAVPAMVGRGKGGIVNIASIAAFQPTPGTATYGATKAYVLSFTMALQAELKGTGVKALVVCPGYTVTGFQSAANYKVTKLAAMASQTAEQVASSSLRALARDRGVFVPGAQNKIAASATHLLPRKLVVKVASLVSGQL